MSINFKVVINNRNRLTTTAKLVKDLLEKNTKEIWIIDNQSTYGPLLDWYNTVPKEVTVLKGPNYGHLALFSAGIVEKIPEEWCFYTDSDIELNPKMPKEYQEIMLDYALQLNCKKIGLAINIKDLPDHYVLKEQVLRNEDRWWHEMVLTDVYKADTDTTFSLIKKVDQFQSYRIAGDFICRHTPWYLDLNNLSDEERFILDHHDFHKVTQYTKQHKAALQK